VRLRWHIDGGKASRLRSRTTQLGALDIPLLALLLMIPPLETWITGHSMHRWKVYTGSYKKESVTYRGPGAGTGRVSVATNRI
jgi:hypothetical protein